MQRILRFLAEDDGPTAVEYAVMLALILGVCLAAIGTVGNPLRESYDHSKDELNTRMNP